MQQVTVMIATKNRIEKLSRCLASIPSLPWVKVVVACDDGKDASEALAISRLTPQPDIVLWCRDDVGVMDRANLLSPMALDGLIGVPDDIEFLPGTLEKSLEKFNREFPDDDGVLGLHQLGIPGYCPTAIALIGQKFLCRYPGKRLMFPGYYHFFGDKEIYHYARSLGKYLFAGEDMAVFHHQGGHEGRACDDTHRLSRVRHREDINLYEERNKEGKVWPLDIDEAEKGLSRPPQDRMIRPENAVIK